MYEGIYWPISTACQAGESLPVECNLIYELIFLMRDINKISETSTTLQLYLVFLFNIKNHPSVYIGQ